LVPENSTPIWDASCKCFGILIEGVIIYLTNQAK
jgi:hypothetical protein